MEGLDDKKQVRSVRNGWLTSFLRFESEEQKKTVGDGGLWVGVNLESLRGRGSFGEQKKKEEATKEQKKRKRRADKEGGEACVVQVTTWTPNKR